MRELFGVQHGGFRDGDAPGSPTTPTSARALWLTMPRDLRMLLAVDCLVRIGEGIASSFIVLFVIQARGFSAADFGVLYGIQHLVAIASYLPGVRIAGVTGRPPVVALTFAFFALFPLAVRLASGYEALAAAFVIGGLKEIGSNLLVVPAGVIGGLLWQQSPALPLEVGSAVSVVGLIVFVVTGSGRES